QRRRTRSSLAFQADAQHDDSQFPYVGAAGRHDLIQLEIDAHRIAGEFARRNIADILKVAGRRISLGRKRGAAGCGWERDGLQLLDGYRWNGQFHSQLPALLTGTERWAQGHRELFFGPAPGAGLDAMEALHQLWVYLRISHSEHAAHFRRLFIGRS